MQLIKKYSLISLLFLSIVHAGFAQANFQRDSLLQVYEDPESNNDAKVKALLSLLENYMEINYDSASHYGKIALDLALDRSDTLTIRSYRELAYLSYMSNKYEDSYQYVSSGIELSLEKEIDFFLMDFYNLNASAMQEQGLFNESMQNFLKSKEIATAKQDTYGLVRVIVNLALVHYRIKDYEKVFENSTKGW